MRIRRPPTRERACARLVAPSTVPQVFSNLLQITRMNELFNGVLVVTLARYKKANCERQVLVPFASKLGCFSCPLILPAIQDKHSKLSISGNVAIDSSRTSYVRTESPVAIHGLINNSVVRPRPAQMMNPRWKCSDLKRRAGRQWIHRPGTVERRYG